MFSSLFSMQAIQPILYNQAHTAGRSVMYALLVITGVWLSIAIYYYFMKDSNVSYAALMGGVGCGFLAIIAGMVDMYYRRQAMKRHILNKLVSEGGPLAEAIYNKLNDQIKHFWQQPGANMAAFIIPALAILYVAGMLRNNKMARKKE